MLTKEQINEIREHLDKAQNPIFYYDNDADGLCSFALLRRYIERGKGVAVRSFPELNESYARKAIELGSDYVFVLDKPVMSKEFAEAIDKLGLPLVWIDHHDLPEEKFEKELKNFFVYNPARNKDEKSDEPVTYWSYKISNKKEDVWIAVMGCIADHYLPDFIDEFTGKYMEYGGNVKKPFDAYYGTEIGKAAMMLNFGLKDSISNVIRLQNFLINAKGPESFFEESKENYFLRKKYNDVKKKYDTLVDKAEASVKGKLIFFDYSGELSISSDVSNEISYKYPDKYIVVAYKKGEISNISVRGKGVKKILERVLEKVGGRGGGHDDAVGARIETKDLEKFREAFEEAIK